MVDRAELQSERKRREQIGLARAGSSPPLPTEEWVQFSDGLTSVSALVLTPAEVVSDRVDVFVHGGGWVFGSPLQTLGIARVLSRLTGRSLVSIKYALAPEHPYPQAIEDVCLVLDCLADAGPLGGIVGVSAGAQIALGAMLRQRDAARPRPKAAILFYGGFAMHANSLTHAVHGHPPNLTAEQMQQFLDAYGVHRAQDQRYGDLTLADLHDAGPMWLACGDADPLLDDTLALYHRTMTAGNTARLAILPQRGHDFIHDWDTDPGVSNALREAFAWLDNVA